MTKVIIAGSRSIEDYDLLKKTIAKLVKEKKIPSKFEVVSGGAKGVDFLAKTYALEHTLEYHEFTPKYKSPKDRAAPLLRNQEMAIFGDLLVALWDGQSTGTKHMMQCMRDLGKPVILVEV